MEITTVALLIIASWFVTQALKSLGFASRYLPIVAIIAGSAIGFVYGYYDSNATMYATIGALSGLAATGTNEVLTTSFSPIVSSILSSLTLKLADKTKETKDTNDSTDNQNKQ